MSFGDGKDEQLKIYDKHNPEKDIYDFCMQRHFDYVVLEEIKRQVSQYLNEQCSFHKTNNSTNNKKLSIRIKPSKKQSKTKSQLKLQKELGGLFQYELSKSYKDVKREYKGVVKERKYSAGNGTRGSVYIGVNSNNNNNNTMTIYKNRSRPLSTSSTRRIPLMGINFNSCKHSKQNINHSQTQYVVHNNNNNNNNVNDIIHEMNPISLIDTQIIKTPSNKYFLTLPSHKTSHIKRIKNIKSTTHHHKPPKTPKPHTSSINPQFTFNPKINKLSKSLLHSRLSKGIACTNSSRILNYNKYIQEQHSKYKAKHACYGKTKETKSNCIFKPQINSKSKHIDSTINTEHKSINRFERLYNYSLVIKKNIEYLKTEEDDKYTYKPHLNSQINSRIQIPFQQRQSQYAQKLQLKKQQLQQQIQLNSNSTFVPKINNNKHYLQTRNSPHYNVFNKLYAYKNIYNNNNNHHKHIHRYHTIETSFQLNNDKNERMLKEKRRKIFTSVFNVLDSDGDNVINARCINYNVLNDELQRILKPVYKELKDENETLSCNEFVQVCEVLYNKMEINAKREFLVEAEHAGKCIRMPMKGCYCDACNEETKCKEVDLKYKKYAQKNFAIGLFYERFVNKINNEESCEFEGN